MPQQGLAAGQPELVHPQPGKDADQAIDLLEREDRLPRQPDVILLRHAVAAAHVAAIGDGDAQALSGRPSWSGSGAAGRRGSSHGVHVFSDARCLFQPPISSSPAPLPRCPAAPPTHSTVPSAKYLLLPDRHPALHLFDDVAASHERLLAMRLRLLPRRLRHHRSPDCRSDVAPPRPRPSAIPLRPRCGRTPLPPWERTPSSPAGALRGRHGGRAPCRGSRRPRPARVTAPSRAAGPDRSGSEVR